MEFKDLDLLAFGNTSTLAAVVYSGNPTVMLWLPNEDSGVDEIPQIIDMTDEDWKVFIKQTDDVNVEVVVGTEKAIMRKSLRAIDQNISWAVYARDSFYCRYCGKTGIPLTVDHIDLWEKGGATVEENLLSACKKCNKVRGNMEYGVWLGSPEYAKVSANLTEEEKEQNTEVLTTLPHLITLRVSKVRSR